jgi:hypothetical protein
MRDDDADEEICAVACRAIWINVLHAGLRDVAAGIDTWWPRSDDFRAICGLVGVEPEMALRALRDGYIAPSCPPKPAKRKGKTK